MPAALIRGRTIHYTLTPSALALDTVFINESRQSGEAWHDVVVEVDRRLEKGEVVSHLAVIDGFGYGLTPSLPIGETLSLEECAEIYIELMTSSGLSEVYLVVHGEACQLAMECLIMAPDLFKKAMFLDPVLRHDSEVSHRAKRLVQPILIVQSQASLAENNVSPLLPTSQTRLITESQPGAHDSLRELVNLLSQV